MSVSSVSGHSSIRWVHTESSAGPGNSSQDVPSAESDGRALDVESAADVPSAESDGRALDVESAARCEAAWRKDPDMMSSDCALLVSGFRPPSFCPRICGC